MDINHLQEAKAMSKLISADKVVEFTVTHALIAIAEGQQEETYRLGEQNILLEKIAEQLEKMNVKPEKGCKRGHIVRDMGCPYCLTIDPDKYPLADGYCPNCYPSDCHCINSQENK